MKKHIPLNLTRIANSGKYKNGGRRTTANTRHADTGTVVKVNPETDPVKIEKLFAKARENRTTIAAENIIQH